MLSGRTISVDNTVKVVGTVVLALKSKAISLVVGPSELVLLVLIMAPPELVTTTDMTVPVLVVTVPPKLITMGDITVVVPVPPVDPVDNPKLPVVLPMPPPLDELILVLLVLLLTGGFKINESTLDGGVTLAVISARTV